MTRYQPAASIANFGGNTPFQPAVRFVPHSEAEVLEVLRTHRGRRIRSIGRLHSWSDVVVCEDILLDLRHLDSVVIHADGESPFVEVGAGCQIKRVIRELNKRGLTLPTIGLIDEQSIAGAAATGTHGSGRSSLSHYIQSVRLAHYDPKTGEPAVREISNGPELQAVRCSLGSLGIITSMRLPIRRQYMVEEHFRRYDQLEQALEQESVYEMQQFFLVPWRWDFLAQHRREAPGRRSRLAWLYRLYWAIGMDVGLHLIVRLMARWLPGSWTRFLFRQVIPRSVPQGWKVVDRSDRQLTMQHELFRHIEIEIFVPRSRLRNAIDHVVWLLQHAAGFDVAPPDSVREWEGLAAINGRYVHHYPVCIRKVEPDDTLISMSSGSAEPYYALSFISYARLNRREGFFQFARVLASTMASLFDARPHWGKFCPLSPVELARLYPNLGKFAAIQKQLDPTGVFGNEWVRGILAADGCGNTNLR